MKRVLLSDFKERTRLKDKTLRRKFGDCIYRIGKVYFIDEDQFDEVFAERSTKGRKNTKPIIESTSVRSIQRVIDTTDVQITVLEKDVIHLTDVEKNAKPGRAKKLAQINLSQTVKKLDGKKSFRQKLNERIDDLIDQQHRQVVLAKANLNDASK